MAPRSRTGQGDPARHRGAKAAWLGNLKPRDPAITRPDPAILAPAFAVPNRPDALPCRESRQNRTAKS